MIIKSTAVPGVRSGQMPLCCTDIFDVPLQPLVVAIGNFDGVHLGHQTVFERMRAAANERGTRTLVITFRDNPKFEQPGHAHILPEQQQMEALYRAGGQMVLLLDFLKYRDYSPEQFVSEVLIRGLHCEAVLVGEGFRFGKDRAGDTGTLRKCLAEEGRELICHPLVRYGGTVLSSTRIRDALSAGDVALAADMLGRPVSYVLPVVEGKKLGRTLGFPTANQVFPPVTHLPRFGVYESEAEVGDGMVYRAISNIGVRPTVGGEEPLLETHLPDFEGELVGKRIRVTLRRFLRPERKFGSTEELRAQIARDVESVRGN